MDESLGQINAELPTVGQSSVMVLINHLVQQGVSMALIDAIIGSADYFRRDQEARLCIDKYQQLWRFALNACQDEALGLVLGTMQEPSEMGIVGHVVFNAKNLKSGLEEYVRLFGIVNDAISLSLDYDEQFATLNFVHHYPEYYCVSDIERSFVSAYCRSKMWFKESPVLSSVHFQHRAPAYVSRYHKIFSCPVYFSQSNCQIVFKTQYFELTPVQANPYLQTAALQYANSLLNKFRQYSLAERVKSLIYKEIEFETPDIAKIARRLNMSQQALYRKLKSEGAFFKKIVESARFDKARQLLSHSALSTSEIALILGFSELSAFSRAFKRWSGMSPKVYREGMTA